MAVTTPHHALEQTQDAAALSRAGAPILRSVFGSATFEGVADELMKGAGSVHCMTGVVHREAV